MKKKNGPDENSHHITSNTQIGIHSHRNVQVFARTKYSEGEREREEQIINASTGMKWNEYVSER